MLKDSINRYNKFSLLDASDLIKNQKFKVILDPDDEDGGREVEVSLGQIDEILEENGII